MDLTALQSDSAPPRIDSSEEGRERLDETGQLVGAPGEIQLTHGPGYGGELILRPRGAQVVRPTSKMALGALDCARRLTFGRLPNSIAGQGSG